MKAAIATLGICGALLTTAATPSQAGDKTVAAAAGFISGALFHHITHPHHVARHVERHVSHRVSRHSGGHRRHHAKPSGHYEYHSERHWVPGSWRYVSDGCGFSRRVWCAGHYDHRQVKVWVAHHGSSASYRHSYGH